jgi:hypothetical protein
MSRENPLWGAPRIHGELLKLGIDVGETSVSKYMGCRRRPPSQTWRTFLNSHLTTTVSVDFFTVPTIRFQVLYVFLVLAHDRRRILHIDVTTIPRRPGRPSNSAKRFRGTRHRAICCAIGIPFSVATSLSRWRRWGCQKSYRRTVRPGSARILNASSARSGANAWIM